MTELSGARRGVRWGTVGRAVTRAVSALHNRVYRLSGGRLGGRIFKSPVLLLTTTGRKSGQPRTVPLLYLADGDTFVIVASYGGSVAHPVWFLNLRAHPEVDVEVKGTRRHMRAGVATAAERRRLWPRLVQMYASYESYQERTERKIPVVILRPV